MKDHRFLLKTYKNCFTGKEAVSSLASAGLARDESEAVVIGNNMIQANIFVHAVGNATEPLDTSADRL